MSAKQFLLLDHDGVLVDTEVWYYEAGRQAYEDEGLHLDPDRYLLDLADGAGTWAQAADVDAGTISRMRAARDAYYQEHLRTEDIEIEGVGEALAELSKHVRMAVVTTAKRADLDLIHEHRRIVGAMEFVLAREDYEKAKPDPEPYLTGLARFGATADQALVVEDSERGLRSAIAAGIECAVVANDFTAGQDFSAATHRVRRLVDLVPIVSGAARL